MTMLSIQLAASSLEDLAWALAEGDHDLGAEATAAGNDLLQWPGTDCPWFNPGPTPVTEADEFRWRWNHGTQPGDRIFDMVSSLPF